MTTTLTRTAPRRRMRTSSARPAPETHNTSVAILNRVLGRVETPFTADAARALARLRFDKSDLRRMNQLAVKARKGTLDDAEREEAEHYNSVSHLLALLQAKARAALSDKPLDS